MYRKSLDEFFRFKSRYSFAIEEEEDVDVPEDPPDYIQFLIDCSQTSVNEAPEVPPHHVSTLLNSPDKWLTDVIQATERTFNRQFFLLPRVV